MLAKKKHIDHFHEKDMNHYTDWVTKPNCRMKKVPGNTLLVSDDEEEYKVELTAAKVPEERSIVFCPQVFNKPIDPLDQKLKFHFLDGFVAGIEPDFDALHFDYLNKWSASNILNFTVDQRMFFSTLKSASFASSILNLVRGSFAFPMSIGRPTNFLAEQEIENAIKEAEYILELPESWDDEGAKVISKELFNSAANFLRQYSNFLLNMGSRLPSPEIDPCKNGSLDLSWRTDSARMLINIRYKGEVPYAYFYGDRNNNTSPIKGNIELSEFSEPLAVWMKYLV